jgi:NADPH:quinone reductase-like Zn-dependent oxidoreductase
MKAVVYDHYGPPEVLHVEEVERPVPKDDEILVKVHATTVNRTDCGWRQASPFFARYFIGWRGPRRPILGMELAGEVAAKGSAVREFEVGDEVFGVKGFGAHAEYAVIRESGAVAHKPAVMSFDEAAAVCDGACIALSCLHGEQLGEGTRILVNGASGSVGTAVVQLARHHGADVTAVCDTNRLELARSLGADRAIDYTREDFTKRGDTYDMIFDAVGSASWRRCRDVLKPGGVFIATDGGVNLLYGLPARLFGDKRLRFGIAKYRKDDVLFLKRLIEAGEYRAVIDRTYPLDDVVEATRYVEQGMKTGNVVLSVNGAGR